MRYLFCFLFMVASAGADNGAYEGPTIESYRALTLAQHRAYQREVRKLLSPDYMQVRIAVTNEERYIGPSIYATPAGRAELQTMASEILHYSANFDQVVFIGRSGQGLMSYLAGVLDRPGARKDLKLRELPYSNNEPREVTREQKFALRQYLALNGLSPRQIVDGGKRVLFMDMVYSGTGIDSLLATLHDWAKEEGIPKAEFKARLGVYGAYPARMIVMNNMMKLNHDSAREGAPISMTEERITQEMSWRRLPGGASYYVDSVYEKQISDKLYEYAGTLTQHPNRSFTPAKWGEPDASEKLRFGDHVGDPAYAEMYYLIQQGRKESGVVLKLVETVKQRCERALSQPRY